MRKEMATHRNQEETSMTKELQFRIPSIGRLFAPVTGNSAAACNRRRDNHCWLVTLILFFGFTAAAHGQQYLTVDCSGANPNDYPSITAALANVTGPGYYILVTGTCTENVVVNNAFNISIGAFYGSTANIVGSVTVNESEGVFLYGLIVTNSTANGFLINSSRAVELVGCSANSNQLAGLNAGSLSDVTVVGPATFDNNGTGGVYLGGNTIFQVNDWQGTTDISDNQGPGVWLSTGALFFSLGTTTISNNVSLPVGGVPQPTFGIVSLGATKVQLGNCYGSNTIQGNSGGGFSIEENSELSLFDCGTPGETYVLDNGPVGISAGFGSQVTLDGSVQVSGHTGSGVEIYGHSQLNLEENTTVISNNGSAGNLRTAGIVVDGNSEAYLRGGQIDSNRGPGILALVNSSADFTDAIFHENSGGVITCDSSSYIASDLSTGAGNPSRGVHCATPHNLGNHHGGFYRPSIPDSTALKLRLAQYRKIASGRSR
jgi:hypothetical protein